MLDRSQTPPGPRAGARPHRRFCSRSSLPTTPICRPGPPVPARAAAAATDDGNFKRGRFSPVAIVVALLLVVGGAAPLYFGVKAEGEKMTVEQIATEKKNIFVLPKKDQAPRWRKWAANSSEPMLQQEALIQLAWAEDPEGVGFAIKALGGGDHRVRGVAAQVLAHYGTPKADAASPRCSRRSRPPTTATGRRSSGRW